MKALLSKQENPADISVLSAVLLITDRFFFLLFLCSTGK
jgi:hypothetical protein